MNEMEIDISARLALHAFLLEQILANGAMSAPNAREDWEKFSKTLMDSIRFRTTAPTDAPGLAEAHERMIEHAERLLSRVAERVEQGRR